MFNVFATRECGCIKKDRELGLPKSFSTKAEAELEALRLSNHMNRFYCKKHRFHVEETNEGFAIEFDYSCKEGGQ